MKFRFLLIPFFCSILIYAQDSTSTDEKPWKNHKWKWDWNWDWDSDDFHDFDRRPMIELNYGIGFPKQVDLINKPSKIGNAEVKIGFSKIENYQDDSDDNLINELEDNYFFASKLSSAILTKKSTQSDITSDMFRFGFGRRQGYGYNGGSIYIIPYHTESFLWSKLNNVDNSILQTPNDFKIARRYLDNFRFSTLSEGGINFEIAQTISLNASYETAVIFPRYQIWKHLGSFAIEMAGQGMIDHFVNKILDRSPVAVPIVSFILKNGLSYSYYLMKKDNMNWPFKTEAPLTYETFKVGLTFIF
ncbi:MAG: hypothetical protein Fur0015_15090 [Ignavibacteriales bacterium]